MCKYLFSLSLQAWSQFAGRLEDLAQPEKLESALSCLNLLVTDALRHVPDVIAYLSRLRNQSVFNFCAIPQVQIQVLACCFMLCLLHLGQFLIMAVSELKKNSAHMVKKNLQNRL